MFHLVRGDVRVHIFHDGCHPVYVESLHVTIKTPFNIVKCLFTSLTVTSRQSWAQICVDDTICYTETND